MGKILCKDKDIVVPGDILAEGMDYLPAGGAFRDGNNLIASQVGLIAISDRLIRVIPMSGRYIPKRGDTVIGKVSSVGANNWFVDVGYANEAMLPVREATSEFVPRGADLTNYYRVGDYIVTKISNTTRQKLVDVSMRGPGLRRLGPGRIIYITPAKVPRVIGKAGSMIQMIKDKTDCRIIVGQNGMTWINGNDPAKENVAVEAIKLIEERSHKTGLTDEIKLFLEKKIKSSPKKEIPKKEEVKAPKKEIKGEKKNVQKKK
jgi:exosome complex component RRP4